MDGKGGGGDSRIRHSALTPEAKIRFTAETLDFFFSNEKWNDVLNGMHYEGISDQGKSHP